MKRILEVLTYKLNENDKIEKHFASGTETDDYNNDSILCKNESLKTILQSSQNFTLENVVDIIIEEQREGKKITVCQNCMNSLIAKYGKEEIKQEKESREELKLLKIDEFLTELENEEDIK